MILTSGRRAEKTLHCLAMRIADALSTAINTTVLQIDGASKASLDSDTVKLDIDERLRRAFEGKKGTAVIHRFEELPPGSTLIFYRYCDHENAAFKDASLIFTVLLEEKDDVQNDASLSDVEEMVQEHIQDRFLSSAQPSTFDKMDMDKLAGLWSRISHLILPVAAEERIELQGSIMSPFLSYGPGAVFDGLQRRSLKRRSVTENETEGAKMVKVPSDHVESVETTHVATEKGQKLTKRKRKITEDETVTTAISSCEDLSMNGDEESPNKIRRLSESGDGLCSDEGEGMEVQDGSEDYGEETHEQVSFCSAEDTEDKEAFGKHQAADKCQSRTARKLDDYELGKNLRSRWNYTEIQGRKESSQRPVPHASGNIVQPRKNYMDALTPRYSIKNYREVPAERIRDTATLNKVYPLKLNIIPQSTMSSSSRYQKSNIPVRKPSVSRVEKDWIFTFAWELECFTVRIQQASDPPTEPASMILTSGRRAEKTLHCLAVRIADALSTAINTTLLQIDGATQASQESDTVKLDVDERLRRAFEGNKGTAVIHRFEELPPGSTLIFYKYCDHENAAFKNTFLIFTVILPVEELEGKLHLNEVEEMVRDHVQERFLSQSHSAAFDKMDVDKFGGLWSRIAHLVLPVALEEDVQQAECQI
ncbi:torsin-1A-interacting protein 2-like [Scleropages formosus]|uniref:Torsin-1A-interacting protein 2-like n=1 Tax=Scleropages formosus TaxID=113540 RepID=A0A0P7Y6N4_SCLFO|nr:torsin-1A-interacting protein 2-like [Scleropages formosus]